MRHWTFTLMNICLLALTASLAVAQESDLKDREIGLLKRRLAAAEQKLQEAQTQRLIYQTLVETASVRGLPVRRPVDYAPLTTQKLDELFTGGLDRQYPDGTLELYTWFYSLLGALPPETDLPALLKGLMGEQVGGLYDPQSKKLFVRQGYDLEGAMGRIILAHEITHALQDQNFDLIAMGVEDMSQSDRAYAVLSVAEGDATLAMSEHLAQYGNLASVLGDLPAMLSMDQEKLNAAPQFVQQSLLFPYLEGMKFFQTLAGRTRAGDQGDRSGPYSWRNDVFRDPPETTEQIIHPNKYLARELPLEIDPIELHPGATRTVTDSLGEFGVMALMTEALGREEAIKAAAGWNGDRLRASEDPMRGRRILTWRTAWDTAADAKEFESALIRALEAGLGVHIEWKRNDTGRTGKLGKSGTLAIQRGANNAINLEINLPYTPKVSAASQVPQAAPSPRVVGQLDVGPGAWVKYFTTLPGENGKPATKVKTVNGKIDVYEVYDWAQHEAELKGQTGHAWYRVDPDQPHWIFGLEQYTFTPKE